MYRTVQLKILVIVLSVFFTTNTVTIFTQSAENTDKYLYGIASIYEEKFEGKTTASGSKYISKSLTAGHRSLPFGTRIEVENLSNGKKVQVIINDRGPFEKNRILNLSKKSAEILEFITEGTTFVKVTILELGSSLPSPLGLPEPPIGKDIPQQAISTNIPEPIAPPISPTPTVEEETPPVPVDNQPVEEVNNTTDEYYDYENDYTQEDELAFLDDTALFADLSDEVDFMDEELTNEDSQLKAQALPTAVDNAPVNAPITGFESTEDLLINDPLSNITIPQSDEYVAAPLPPMENEAPYELTPEEKKLLEDNSINDPFADLFSDSTEPFPFQSEVGSTVRNSPLSEDTTAENVNGDNDGLTNITPKPKPIMQTNTVVVTNFVTNSIDNPTESEQNSSDSTPTQVAPPTNETFDDFYYDDESNAEEVTPQTSQPLQQPTKSEQTSSDSAPTQVAPPTQKEHEPLELQKLGNHYILQLGAFSRQKNALSLYENLRKTGFNAYITDVKIKGQNLMRVRVGYFKTLDEALQVSLQLKENYNLENRIIQVDYEEDKQ